MSNKKSVTTLCLVIAVCCLGALPVAYSQTNCTSSPTNCTTEISADQYKQLSYSLLRTKLSPSQGWQCYHPCNNAPCTVGSTLVNKHPGIDYPAGAGTAVYAPVGGKVTRAEPGSATALSTLAIYNSRTNKTSIFLHMETISVTQDSIVVAGQKVGTVGKRGAQANHLHYEVRDESQRYAATCVNGTVNPYLYTPPLWDFDVYIGTDPYERWSKFNLSSWSIVSQALVLDPAGADPYIVSPDIKVDAAVFKYAKLRMASNALDGNGCIYFKTSTRDFYSEDKKKCFPVSFCPLCSTTTYNDKVVDMSSNNPTWSGEITGIRLDPANNGKGGTPNDSVRLDYIMLSRYGL